MAEIELELPEDKTIRRIMEDEAQKLGLNLSNSKLAELQPLAGKNPMLARKVKGAKKKLGE
jgi:AAA+ superfamily predicted ATPase